MKDVIPVFFACNDRYVPYLDTAIISLVSHVSDDNEYRIKVMKTDISEENQRALKKHAKTNVSIEFFDVQDMLEPVKGKLPEMFYFGVAAYFRFFIETSFPQYDKAVYLDSDVILLEDIAELYRTDIG
ncbi:MAG: glycosyltransferase family 8 protein, partial [Clostridia bacterium]|nr:glycosyltransferase family 8 protein [Clostridia bacterium]